MKEQEIRPEKLLARYLELTAKDAVRYFSDTARSAVACVACGGTRGARQFEKDGFAYVECTDCGTLFQSPRPAIAAFEAFYRVSESSRYWAEVFFPAVAEARREKMFRPRVERLAELCQGKGARVERLMDVGAGYGIFLDEWRKRFPATQIVAVEPSPSLAEQCRSKGFEVVEEIAEHVAGHEGFADLVVCFEVLEHVHAPLEFLKVLKCFARPGGYVFTSAPGIDGFDLRVLWEKSSQISPPHHINFMSVRGFERLFHRAGLTEVDVTTPGVLDVDIVRNAVKRDPSLLTGQRFLRGILEGDETTGAAFQRFLTERRMSSHAWVIGRRPTEDGGPA